MMDGITARLRSQKDALARAFAFTTAVVTVCAAVVVGGELRDSSRGVSATPAAAATDPKDQGRLDQRETPDLPATPLTDAHQGANDAATPTGAAIGAWRHEEFTFVDV